MFKQICEIYSLECLLQIGQDIVDMLRSDGQAHRAWPDAGLGQLLLAHLGMGGTGRMDGQGLDVRHIGQQGKHLQPVDEGPGRLGAAPDFEGEDGAGPFGEIPPVQRVIGTVRQGGMVDPFHRG